MKSEFCLVHAFFPWAEFYKTLFQSRLFQSPLIWRARNVCLKTFGYSLHSVEESAIGSYFLHYLCTKIEQTKIFVKCLGFCFYLCWSGSILQIRSKTVYQHYVDCTFKSPYDYESEPFILGKLQDNTASVGWRNNYPWYMVHFIFF